MTTSTAADGAATATGAFRVALAEELRVHMTRKQVTGRELARRLHVSSQWISQRTRAVVPMDADDMEMVSGALGISVTELLMDAARRVSESVPVGGATDGPTRGYGRGTSPRPATLTLVSDTTGSNRGVAVGYGSSAHTSGYDCGTTVLRSAATVNDADAA